MSKGGGQTTQESKVTVPEEFKGLIFGPSGGVGGGGAGGAVGFDGAHGPAGRSQIGKGRFSDKGVVGRTLDEQQAQQNAVRDASILEGFGGILPEAQRMFLEGSLAAEPVQGQTTLDALEARKNLAGQFETDFLPNIQDIFSSFGERSGSIADIATEGLERQLTRNTLPTIGEGAIQAGQFGSSRQGIAEGLATAEANRDIADVRAQILQRGAQTQMQFAPQLMQLLGLPSQLLGETGAAEDQFAGQQSESQFENLLRLAQLVQGFVPGSNQTQISTAPKTSPFQTLMGGALALGGLGVGGPAGAAGGTLLGNLLSP